ncbi:MAG: BACON domain-containing carbohydrate-binding protein [Alistipes sp.]|nr:BACON domain-containing carbohydrate-binding protein [Alistipes sp.]
MKKFFRSLMLVALTAMGFVACQNEFAEPDVNVPASDDIVVSFVSEEPTTRTSVDTSDDAAPKFSWNDSESFAVLEQTDALAVGSNVAFEKVDGKAKISAAFAAKEGKEAYSYVTIHPVEGYVAAESIKAATLSLPDTQSMADASYDPCADLMVSRVVTTAKQPTEAQQVQFTRLAAVVKMTLKNLTLEAGDEVEKVIFSAEGKALAGTITADLTAPHDFAVAEGVSSVSVATTSKNDVYFTVLPTVLEAGESYTITVVTNKKFYIKQGTIADGKTLSLEAGMVNRFGVNMMGVVGSDKWTLVRDASTLKQGDIVTIVAKDYDKAISKKLYSNASETYEMARRDAVDITKVKDYLIATADVQPFTLVTGSVDGTFSFYDAAREKFLVSNNKSTRYLINQPYIDANTSFAFTINAEDGDATIKNVEGEYPNNMIRYYNASRYFYSGESLNQAVCVYRLEGSVGAIPTVPANVIVPDEDESVVIAEEGATEATAISTEQVKFNYVGEWTISAKAEAEWLNVAYDAANNCLTYTAEANTGAKRATTVTITASMEGKESLTWSFSVEQKGAPQEISIAEFIKLAKDENSVYKITGRITEMKSSSDGTFKLADEQGNIATVTYLYTDDGSKVYGDDTINLAVDDVLTVTTVVASTSKGKGGSSTYHSIYKGHYGMKTTMGLAADYTGGSVEIGVATYSNGNITIPESVTATMAESDFAELSYSGGDTATVTFTSENTTTDAREVEVTFTYGLISVTVVAEQGINPANKVGYELVSDASTLAVGDEVIIVAVSSDKALACLASTASATGVSTIPAVDIKKSGNVIYDVEEAGVMLLTLKAGMNDGEFAFQFTHKDVNYYLNAPSSGFKGRAASSGANTSTSFAIAIDATTGAATIQNQQPRIIKFNSKTTTNFTAFKLDAEGATLDANHIAIYKKQK